MADTDYKIGSANGPSDGVVVLETDCLANLVQSTKHASPTFRGHFS